MRGRTLSKARRWVVCAAVTTLLALGVPADAAVVARLAHAAGLGAAAGCPVCSPEWLRAMRMHARAPGAAMWLDATPPPDGALGEATQQQPAPAQDLQDVLPRYPDDTFFRLYQQNSLMAIGALDAWETSRGGPDVVVAVIGTGVHYEHPDLATKMWSNPGERPGNGVDDDGNGYRDDIVGWSFPDQRGTPMDIPRGRGTMMAGVVGAATNNGEGVAGVSWGARIMALKTFVSAEGPDGPRSVGTVEDIVEAVCYATRNGADVILLGGWLQNPADVAPEVERLRQAIEAAHAAGAVVVAPAGDCGQAQSFCPAETYGPNPPILPAAFNHVIAAQAYSANQAARPEASSGPWVDISAPGEEFMTTGADPPYSYVKHQRATSDFAAAHVAGVVAVLRSVNPDLSPYQIEQLLCLNATRPRDISFEPGPGDLPHNDQWGCGMLNFERAVEATPPKMRVVPRYSTLTSTSPGSSPALVRQFSDGLTPWPSIVFDNPYLSAGAWSVTSDVPWLGGQDVEERRDGLTWARVDLALNRLSNERGPLQSGQVYHAELQACATGWAGRCQSFAYQLTLADRVRRAYLPAIRR